MFAAAATENGEGGDSNDECCVCGDEWSDGRQGWVLCDTGGCENTVCPECVSSLSLSVSELFYCPACAGSGASAAAAAGGAVASAVAACSELERLPLSFRATQRILTNLMDNPDEHKYRRLRLENKSVRELVDLEPVLNILTSVGFVRTQCARDATKNRGADALPPTEEVLLLEGPVPTTQINELLQILNGLSAQEHDGSIDANKSDSGGPSTAETNEKRKPSADASDGDVSNKKQRGGES